MNMKIDLILLLITVGSVSSADCGRIGDFFTRAKTSPEPSQEDPLKFMEPYMETAKREFEEKYNHRQPCNGKLSDYELTAWLDKGVSEVVLGKVKGTKNYQAIKIVRMHEIVRQDLIEDVLSEKRILQSINFPFLLQMKSCFKYNFNIYFAMEYSPCGRLPTVLSENVVKFYAAQIVLALHYLHTMNIIYQDLKVENVLIGQDGYIKIADFGSSIRTINGIGDSQAGSVACMAPEMLHLKKYDKSVDWWSLGVLIYQMISGRNPFGVKNVDSWKVAYWRIQTKLSQVKFGPGFSEPLKDLLKNLLQINPQKRYGMKKIVNHEWFRDMNWEELYNKKTTVPYQPTCRKPETFEKEKSVTNDAIGPITSVHIYSKLIQSLR